MSHFAGRLYARDGDTHSRCDELRLRRPVINGRQNKGGGPLAPKTVRHVYVTVHSALNDALRKGSVSRNVADVADPLTLAKGARPKMKVWTADELRRFF
jgi:hypothetical protein